MKITAIKVYKVDLKIKDAPYSWSTFSVDSFDSTIVEIETDAGISGVGEICPHGPSYLPAFAEGARTGIATLGPKLIGMDPRQLGQINQAMDHELKGHIYFKSALDMACWDILGKATNLPLYTLLGGLQQEKVRLYKVVSRDEPGKMASVLRDYQDAGYTHFQVKVGDNPAKDIERIRRVAQDLIPGNSLAADANTSWKQHEAMRVAGAISDLPVYLEQPCPTYEECLAVRQHCNNPYILDEVVDSLSVLMRGYQDKAMDVVNLKISRFGGLTKARMIRDLCTQLGIAMTIEDTWGSEIATAAIAHLSMSTTKGFHHQSCPFQLYHTNSTADGAPVIEGGMMWASDRPGLGVSLRHGDIGDPVQVIS
ncbi:mandelate racemase (plasmid) [Phaeobacter inhibens]|uniref:cis-3-hydroxy-L-proline dehydratase n=1 Tax=Phaeobacter inhibens TaxID=221822 RepID=UPI0009717CFE|nr:cis-3-hydroxy-L-proline dehydratase [Phaeobacter inhibens]APX18096.1 mandelate racemase [Phaeobacter inhibens]